MASSVLRATPFAGNTRPLAARPAARPAAVVRRVRADAAPAAAPAVFTPPVLDPNTPSPVFGGSTGGLLRKAQVRAQRLDRFAEKLRARVPARGTRARRAAAVQAWRARLGRAAARRPARPVLSPAQKRFALLARLLGLCHLRRRLRASAWRGLTHRGVRLRGRGCGARACSLLRRSPLPAKTQRFSDAAPRAPAPRSPRATVLGGGVLRHHLDGQEGDHLRDAGATLTLKPLQPGRAFAADAGPPSHGSAALTPALGPAAARACVTALHRNADSSPPCAQTGGAAFMREGPNLLKLARKEQCMALLMQLRTGFKLDGRVYRVYPSGEVQYLHPKDGVYPEKVNKGRVGANNVMRSIGKNPEPASVRAQAHAAGLFLSQMLCAHAFRPPALRHRSSSPASWARSRRKNLRPAFALAWRALAFARRCPVEWHPCRSAQPAAVLRRGIAPAASPRSLAARHANRRRAETPFLRPLQSVFGLQQRLLARSRVNRRRVRRRLRGGAHASPRATRRRHEATGQLTRRLRRLALRSTLQHGWRWNRL